MNWNTAFDYHKNLASLWSRWYQSERFEKWAASFFARAGYEVLNSGWPDLLMATPQGKICAVELKQGTDTVKPNQKRVHELLRRAGVPTIVLRSNPSMARFLQENDMSRNPLLKEKKTPTDFDGLGVS